MAKRDQEARADFVKATPAVIANAQAIDAANTRRMKEIIRLRGFPGRSLVGLDGAQAAFLLVQHADQDLAFQKAVLPQVERAYTAGEVPGEAVALLTDRILVAEGKPQRYGSQVAIENGTIRVQPTIDDATLDSRRSQLGLPPMREYLKLLRETYQLPGLEK